MNEEQESALRPLRNVGETVAALRSGAVSGEDARAAAVQVAAAVEMSLRRLLRDLPQAALQVRLRALAPDELRADEVLAELRQHDRISMELAAAVHDLFELRQRVRTGGPLASRDVELSYLVADRLEHEVRTQRTEPATSTVVHDETLVDETLAAPAERGGFARDIPRRWLWAAAGLLVLLVVGIGIWQFRPRNQELLDQGITLFRSGSYAESASYFWRYAQAHPDDVTPHLYLARVHRRMQRLDMAAQELRKALELAPEDADVHTELGFLLLDSGRTDEAVNRFQAAVRLDSDAEAAWIGLIRALHDSGREDAAQRVLQQAPAIVRERFSRAAPAATDAP